MTLDDLKQFLYKERMAVDAISTTVKQNMASLMAIAAAIAIPLVPAIFSANGVYSLTASWQEEWRVYAAYSIAIAVEGAGMFLSLLATKTYSGWRKKIATRGEVIAMIIAVGVYTIIVIALMAFADVPVILRVILSLIPLLGVAFYIGLGYETDLANRLDEKNAEKAGRRIARQMARQADTPHDNVASRVVDATSRRDIVAEFVRQGRPVTDMASELNVSVRTIQRDIKALNGHVKEPQ